MVNWDQFRVCNRNARLAFEDMSRMLFRHRYLASDTELIMNPNNPGIEVEPAWDREHKKRISYQSKFFDNNPDYQQILHSVEETVKHYAGQLDRVYLYCNRNLTLTAKTYVKARTLLENNSIELIPVCNDEILDQVREDQLVEHTYNTALLWCRVFLMGKSFTSFAGSEVALALLFPMETLFESYIAALMRKQLDTNAYAVSAQDKRYHLFDEPRGQFQLRPDIVITRKADGAIFVLDTKWKLLAEGKANYGISQADMYQMYAYQKKYGSQNVTLIYPKTSAVPADREIRFASDDGVTVNVRFVDLFAPQNNMSWQFEMCVEE